MAVVAVEGVVGAGRGALVVSLAASVAMTVFAAGAGLMARMAAAAGLVVGMLVVVVAVVVVVGEEVGGAGRPSFPVGGRRGGRPQLGGMSVHVKKTTTGAWCTVRAGCACGRVRGREKSRHRGREKKKRGDKGVTGLAVETGWSQTTASLSPSPPRGLCVHNKKAHSFGGVRLH